MGPSCRLRGTSAAVGRGRRTRRNGREIRKFAREVPATFGDSSFAPAAWIFAVSKGVRRSATDQTPKSAPFAQAIFWYNILISRGALRGAWS